MSTEESTYHPLARPFTNVLEVKTPEGDAVLPDPDREDVRPFSYFATFDGVVEEWRREHVKDGQLTKVQINFVTGEVTVFKKLTAAEISASKRKTAKGWAHKTFSLTAPNGFRNAASYCFR